MLVKMRADGAFHRRPMAVAELKKDTGNYFVTSLDSPKNAEIEARPDVMVTFQSSSQYAVVAECCGERHRTGKSLDLRKTIGAGSMIPPLSPL